MLVKGATNLNGDLANPKEHDKTYRTYHCFLTYPRSIRVQPGKNVESWNFQESYLDAH